MIIKGFNNVRVVYQTPIDDNALGNSAVIVHRDNGGTLCLSQEDQTLVIDLHRGNIKQIFSAIQAVLDDSEQEARKKSK